jgi:hypothetical protein
MIHRTYRNFFRGEFDPNEFKADIALWQGIFKDDSFQDVSTAFGVWATEQDRPPVPAQLKRLLKTAQKPDVFMPPELAWAKAHKSVTRTFGRYNKKDCMAHLIHFNPAIAKAVEAVGYDQICNAGDEDVAYKKRDFMTYYNEYSSPVKRENLLPENIYKRIQEMSQQDIKRLGDKQDDVSEM